MQNSLQRYTLRATQGALSGQLFVAMYLILTASSPMIWVPGIPLVVCYVFALLKTGNPQGWHVFSQNLHTVLALSSWAVFILAIRQNPESAQLFWWPVLLCASSILLSFTRFLLVAGLALLALAYCASLPASQFLLMVTLPYLCLVAMCYLTKDTFRQSLRRVIQLSGSDLETGCENKLRLREALQAALALHKRYGTAVCALVFCVQSATEANASLPIPADAGLRKLCGLWRSRLRTTDRLFRLTDNRFVFLLLETGEAGATSLLQDLLHATHHYEIGELPTLQISHCCLPVQGVQSVDAWLANMMSHQCSV